MFSAKTCEFCEFNANLKSRLNVNIQTTYSFKFANSHTHPHTRTRVSRARVRTYSHSDELSEPLRPGGLCRATLARYSAQCCASLGVRKPRALKHSLFGRPGNLARCDLSRQATTNTSRSGTRAVGASGRVCWPTVATQTEEPRWHSGARHGRAGQCAARQCKPRTEFAGAPENRHHSSSRN